MLPPTVTLALVPMDTVHPERVQSDPTPVTGVLPNVTDAEFIFQVVPTVVMGVMPNVNVPPFTVHTPPTLVIAFEPRITLVVIRFQLPPTNMTGVVPMEREEEEDIITSETVVRKEVVEKVKLVEAIVIVDPTLTLDEAPKERLEDVKCMGPPLMRRVEEEEDQVVDVKFMSDPDVMMHPLPRDTVEEPYDVMEVLTFKTTPDPVVRRPLELLVSVSI